MSFKKTPIIIKFVYLIKIDGPTYSKETTSVTSSATENEFTITGKIEVSLEDNKGNIIIQNKVFSLSKDHKFSSSNINSSESEENTIKSDIEKYLQIQAKNKIFLPFFINSKKIYIDIKRCPNLIDLIIKMTYL